MTDQAKSSALPNGLPPPPIPQRLRELLKGYPEHLARIQEVLNRVVLDHVKSIPMYEQALWALEGRTGSFINEAQLELEAVQASGDVDLIARAEAKASLMRRARSPNGGLKGMHELWGYFETYKDVIK